MMLVFSICFTFFFVGVFAFFYFFWRSFFFGGGGGGGGGVGGDFPFVYALFLVVLGSGH